MELFLEHWQTIVIALSILLILYFYCITPYQSLRSCHHNGPTPLPFFGHLHDTIRHKGKFYLQMDEYYKKYGSIFSMVMFSSKPCLVISDPEMIKDIFIKEFDSFSDRPNIVKQPEPLDSMLTIAEREKWKRIRNTLTPAFSGLKMKQMLPLMNACCDCLMKKLAEVADKEKSVCISKFHQCLTMDVIVSAAFGLEVDSQMNPEEPILNAVRLATTPNPRRQILLTLLSLMPFGQGIMEKIPSIWMGHLKPLIDIAEEIVCFKRNAESTTRKDMLDLMLLAADDSTLPESKKLSNTEIIAQSLVFLFAGHETTSTTLSFVCLHLATNPDIQDKLQSEIDSVWDGEHELSYDKLHDLLYLDMVISETLRLYPPGFLVLRTCTKDCILKGVKIAKGTAVLVPVYSIHRDASFYPDPERFDPERFSSINKQSRNPYCYVPFGHGPHNCIGLRFAMMEMKLVLTRMLKKYRFKVAEDTTIPPEIIVKSTLSCSDINLRVTSRNS